MIPKFRVWLPDVNKMLNVKALIFEKNKTRCMCGYAYNFYLEDENATVMQSTGLKDKNGKEIFEGDIIDTTDYEGGLSSVGNPFVKIERDKYGFVVTGDFPTSPITIKEFEVGRKFAGVEVIIVGNIYENPELVEADNDPKRQS